MLVRQIANALRDQPALHRRAPGRIDDNGHGRGRLDGEGLAQQGLDSGDVEPARTLLGGDDALQAHHGNDGRTPHQPAQPIALRGGRFGHVHSRKMCGPI